MNSNSGSVARIWLLLKGKGLFPSPKLTKSQSAGAGAGLEFLTFFLFFKGKQINWESTSFHLFTDPRPLVSMHVEVSGILSHWPNTQQ